MNEFFEAILDFLQLLIQSHPMSIDSLTLVGLLPRDAMIPHHLLLIIKHRHHLFENIMIQDQLISIIQLALFHERRTKVFGIHVDIFELYNRDAVLLMQLVDEMSIVRRAIVLEDLLAGIMRVLAFV